VVLCLAATDRRREECERAGAEGASLPVLELEAAEWAEILTIVSTVVLMVTVTAGAVGHWGPGEAVVAVAEGTAGRSPAGSGLHEQESCPLRYSQALGCLHSRSNSHSAHLLVQYQPCSRFWTLFGLVVVYI
jgi:hypothetical protein